MSDERLRELERRFKESGGIEDEIAYLQERVRQGLVSEERLGYTAQYGALASQLVLGIKDVFTPAYVFENVTAHVQGLGREAMLVAALAAARSKLWIWDRNHVDDQRLNAALDSVAAWLECPCLKHSRICVLNASKLASGVSRPFYTIRESNVAEIMRLLANSIRGCTSVEKYDWHTATEVIFNACRVDKAFRLAQARPEMAKAVVQALVPWALGYNATVVLPQEPETGTD